MYLRALLVWLAIVVPACADDAVIKIVSSLPRTGAAKGQTDSIVNGIKLALEEVENKVGKFKIIYADFDDASVASGTWDAELESANAEKAAQDRDVMVYIGPHNSGAATVSMPILNKSNLLMISPSCTFPGLTKPGFGDGKPHQYRPFGKVNFLRLVTSDDLQAPAAAKFVKEELKLKKVWILDDAEFYGKLLADIFKTECGKVELKVLGHESIDTRQKSHAVLLRKIKRQSPDLIYFGGTTQSGGPQIVRDMIEVGLKCPLMVPDGCYEKGFIESAEADAFKRIKCFVSFGGNDPTHPVTERAKKFLAIYKKTFRAVPDSYAVYGYESARVALAAIGKAGKKDRAAIVKAALDIKDFQTAVGVISFDKNGDAIPGLVTISTIDGKSFKSVKEIAIK